MQFISISKNLDAIYNICYKRTKVMSSKSIFVIKALIFSFDLHLKSLVLLTWTFKILGLGVLFPFKSKGS